MPREFSRNQRLGNQILRSLNELLRFETKDPRLEFVSLTSVDLSRDLSVARVYFSILDPSADPAPVQQGLEKADSFAITHATAPRRSRISSKGRTW